MRFPSLAPQDSSWERNCAYERMFRYGASCNMRHLPLTEFEKFD
jgi:hypothetical protein